MESSTLTFEKVWETLEEKWEAVSSPVTSKKSFVRLALKEWPSPLPSAEDPSALPRLMDGDGRLPARGDLCYRSCFVKFQVIFCSVRTKIKQEFFLWTLPVCTVSLRFVLRKFETCYTLSFIFQNQFWSFVFKWSLPV